MNAKCFFNPLLGQIVLFKVNPYVTEMVIVKEIVRTLNLKTFKVVTSYTCQPIQKVHIKADSIECAHEDLEPCTTSQNLCWALYDIDGCILRQCNSSSFDGAHSYFLVIYGADKLVSCNIKCISLGNLQ